ncbi:hypothetical protein GF367_04985 [Candidatus Woesearchaeota archaeon]|nr:hypothetical protein [Candidatus Woesearchaeota archaeon]
MHLWICNQCSAEIPQEGGPEVCPLCNQHDRGFEESEKKVAEDTEDKKYSALYREILKELEKYDEGCEPQQLKFCCEE